MKMVGAGQKAEGLRLLTELLQKYPQTQFVKDRQSTISSLIEKMAPSDKK
jgi:outer membrane protein assembly factor BamD (BamD/ComL family)